MSDDPSLQPGVQPPASDEPLDEVEDQDNLNLEDIGEDELDEEVAEAAEPEEAVAADEPQPEPPASRRRIDPANVPLLTEEEAERMAGELGEEGVKWVVALAQRAAQQAVVAVRREQQAAVRAGITPEFEAEYGDAFNDVLERLPVNQRGGEDTLQMAAVLAVQARARERGTNVWEEMARAAQLASGKTVTPQPRKRAAPQPSSQLRQVAGRVPEPARTQGARPAKPKQNVSTPYGLTPYEANRVFQALQNFEANRGRA